MKYGVYVTEDAVQNPYVQWNHFHVYHIDFQNNHNTMQMLNHKLSQTIPTEFYYPSDIQSMTSH